MFNRERGTLLSYNTETNLDKFCDPSLKWVENAMKGSFKDKQKEKLMKEL